MVEDNSKKQFSIRFNQEAVQALTKMADEEGISKAELIRRAINFYEIKLIVLRERKRILLEDVEGGQVELLLIPEKVK